MAIQYKGPQYLKIAKDSARRTSENKNWWQKSLMGALDDRFEEEDKLSFEFLETIADNSKLQKEADADYANAEGKVALLEDLNGWDEAMKPWAMNHLMYKTKTINQMETLILDGSVIPVTKKKTEVADLPDTFYAKISNQLAEAESTNNWKAEVQLNSENKYCPNGKALGMWQFTTCTLEMFKKGSKFKKFNNSQFLNSPELQRAAMTWYLKKTNNYIKDNKLDKYLGKTINGVTVTREGMFAVAHLGGRGALKQWLTSNGKKNGSDQNGTSWGDYMKRFGEMSSPEVSEKDKDSVFNKIFGMFSSGKLARSRAIKMAQKYLGMSQANAEAYLDGKLFNKADFLGSPTYTVAGKLPDISKVTSLLDWEAMNTSFNLNNMEQKLGKERFETFMENSFKPLRQKIIKTKAEENFNESVNDPKFVFDLTLKEAQAFKEAYKDETNFGLLDGHINSLTGYLKTVDLMPEAPDKKEGIPSWRLELKQIYGETLPGVVKTAADAIETSLKTMDNEDFLRTLNSPTEIIMYNAINSPEYKNADTPEAKNNVIIEAYKKIKEAEKTASDPTKAPTTVEEALTMVWTGNDQAVQLAEKWLSGHLEADIKTEMVYVEVTQKDLDDKFGVGVKNAEDYKKYRVPVLSYKRYNNTNNGFDYFPASSLGVTETPSALVNAIKNADASDAIKGITQNKQEFVAYKETLTDLVSFNNSMYNLVELVSKNPESIVGAAGGTASIIQDFSQNVKAFDTMFNDLFNNSNDTIPSGEEAGERYVTRENIEQGLIRQNIFDEGDTFDSILSGDLGKIGDIASARKRFLAESVMIIFKTGSLMGQTGQGMSNKDFDRFAAFVRGFNKFKDFESSVKNFIRDQVDVNKSRAALFNNPESNPTVRALVDQIGFIPLLSGEVVQNIEEFYKSNNNDEGLRKLNYFLGNESFGTPEGQPQVVDWTNVGDNLRQEQFGAWANDTSRQEGDKYIYQIGDQVFEREWIPN